jgi:hypothetical protein
MRILLLYRIRFDFVPETGQDNTVVFLGEIDVWIGAKSRLWSKLLRKWAHCPLSG